MKKTYTRPDQKVIELELCQLIADSGDPQTLYLDEVLNPNQDALGRKEKSNWDDMW